MTRLRLAPLLHTAVSLASLLISAVLIVFGLRRILFTATILMRGGRGGHLRREPGDTHRWPEVLVLVPCRDEESVIADLCQALDCLEYPGQRHRVVLIDDGSQDSTVRRMHELVHDRLNWSVLSMASNVGKSRALNAALARFPFGEIVYVFDADHRPNPDVLIRAVPYFDDARVAGVSGLMLPSNPLASPSAYYSAVESYVHQMVTMRAKDRLGLAPALLGSNCAYRRSALVECGGFRDGALLEDSDLTIAFYRAGYQIRFAQEAVSRHQVPETVESYLKQHARWARGFNDVAQTHAPALIRMGGLPLPVRVELLLFASGYLDRLAVIGGVALTVLPFINTLLLPFHRAVLRLALLTPMAQIALLFAEQHVSRAMWLRLPLVPLFYAVDILAAARAMTDSLLRRKRVWAKTKRQASPHSENVGLAESVSVQVGLSRGVSWVCSLRLPVSFEHVWGAK